MFIFILVIAIALDFYVYSAISSLAFGNFQVLALSVYWLSVVLTLIGIFKFMQDTRKGIRTMNPSTNLLFGLAFSFIVAKIFYAAFLLGEDVFRALAFAGKSIFLQEEVHYSMRSTFWSWTGIGISAIPFIGMCYGVVVGKYRYTTRTVKLKFNNLPSAFHGFRIVQFSDAHLGSFDSIAGLRKGIQSILDAKPDVILFTGDLVNNLASEAEPYIEEFQKLKAPHGIYSVLGNHDYSDYVRWPSRQLKQENLERLKQIQAKMGFEMLHNRHVILKKENEQIAVAGVENWGKPPFPQFGDLDKALSGIPLSMFTVLMSHDPSHWDVQVKQHPKTVNITLSGHTHGMQFGIDLPFFKWSPVKWKYPKWAGLYEEAGKYLYVNRGFGFIGFPGRAGVWPEITVIELEQREHQ
ncbi:MAG: phosphoesterase [Crocinitomicaceae bacterium]|nr:phosphoesterase [Crocinitomicaceae bacterium]|tara:strand:- start:6456 stop:7682 length:1227 start_codon:yes stop_codon:yes gene_type:complete